MGRMTDYRALSLRKWYQDKPNVEPSMNNKLIESIFQEFDIPIPVYEYKFHEKRKWRFDMAWLEFKVAVEVEGGVFTQGRHTRGNGFINDMEKYNSAIVLGWKLLRYTPDQMTMTKTSEQIKLVLNRS